jgi:hypothetical protein
VGIGLGTYWPYDASVTTQTTAVNIALGIHMVLAIALLFGAIAALVGAIRSKSGFTQSAATIGLFSILGAAAGGSMVTNGGSQNTGIFLMSVFFLVAFVVYGRWLLEVTSGQKDA